MVDSLPSHLVLNLFIPCDTTELRHYQRCTPRSILRKDLTNMTSPHHASTNGFFPNERRNNEETRNQERCKLCCNVHYPLREQIMRQNRTSFLASFLLFHAVARLSCDVNLVARIGETIGLRRKEHEAVFGGRCRDGLVVSLASHFSHNLMSSRGEMQCQSLRTG